MSAAARLCAGVPETWRAPLASVVQGRGFAQLAAFLEAERAAAPVYPPPDEVFTALAATPPASVRIVVLGQDPYHGPGEAHGLCFSVRRQTAIPASLRNIFKEREADLGLAPPPHGDLSAWARRGALLLNTVLTVRGGEAGSHRGRGWEAFTAAVLECVLAGPRPVVFVLWGATARACKPAIGASHRVVEGPHPSPLSAHRGFFGSRPFSAVDQALAELGQAPFDWRTDD
jgi:uracil-DNA glycosylase